jgi:outer membrane protein assembly factor BamB
MKLPIKHLLVAWLCLIATFSTQAQGIRLWDKKINARPQTNASLLTAVESQSKKFWVAVSEIDYQKRPNSTQYNRSASVLAFRADTGDTLWYKKLGEQYYNGFTVSSESWGVAPAPNGQFWIAIQFDWTALNQGAIAVFRIDSMGNVLQHKEFMRDCRDFISAGMFPMPDGGFVLTGTMDRSINCTEFDVFATRIDGQCNEVWTQIYPIVGQELIDQSDLYPGNKLCITYHSAFSYDNYLRIIDVENGVTVRYEAVVPLDDSLKKNVVYPLRDGSFIFCGDKIVNNGLSTQRLTNYLARADASFNVIWERYEDTLVFLNSSWGPGYPIKMKETVDNAVIMAAADRVASGGCFSKIDLATGQEIWRKPLKDTMNTAFGINGICINAQNDLYILGSSTIPATPFTQVPFYYARYQGIAQFLQPSDYCSDSLRAKITGSWQLDTLRLRSESNAGVAFQQQLEYQWFINGTTVSIDSAFQQNILHSQYPNGVVVKLLITNFWGCKDSLEVLVTPDGINGTDIQNRLLVRLGNAYPNPSTQHVTVGYTLPAKTENAILRVYEIATGRMVAERHLSASSDEAKFDVSRWATGVYAYLLYVNGVPMPAKRMTVAR